MNNYEFDIYVIWRIRFTHAWQGSKAIIPRSSYIWGMPVRVKWTYVYAKSLQSSSAVKYPIPGTLKIFEC